jgi:hypothetical protein
MLVKSPKETHPRRVEKILKAACKTKRTLPTEVEAKAILSSCGFSMVETRCPDSREEAVELILGKRVESEFWTDHTLRSRGALSRRLVRSRCRFATVERNACQTFDATNADLCSFERRQPAGMELQRH